MQRSWMVMVLALGLVGVTASRGLAQQAAPAPAAAATTSGLAPAPEAPLVQAACTGCHVASQFTSRHRTSEQWSETVNQMIGYGAQVPDDQFDRIVGYLARNYGPAQPAKPAG